MLGEVWRWEDERNLWVDTCEYEGEPAMVAHNGLKLQVSTIRDEWVKVEPAPLPGDRWIRSSTVIHVRGSGDQLILSSLTFKDGPDGIVPVYVPLTPRFTSLDVARFLFDGGFCLATPQEIAKIYNLHGVVTTKPDLNFPTTDVMDRIQENGSDAFRQAAAAIEKLSLQDFTWDGVVVLRYEESAARGPVLTETRAADRSTSSVPDLTVLPVNLHRQVIDTELAKLKGHQFATAIRSMVLAVVEKMDFTGRPLDFLTSLVRDRVAAAEAWEECRSRVAPGLRMLKEHHIVDCYNAVVARTSGVSWGEMTLYESRRHL